MIQQTDGEIGRAADGTAKADTRGELLDLMHRDAHSGKVDLFGKAGDHFDSGVEPQGIPDALSKTAAAKKGGSLNRAAADEHIFRANAQRSERVVRGLDRPTRPIEM